MYTVSNELLFHGAETEFALPICKAYSALKIWAYKMARRVLWNYSTYGKSNTLLYSSMHQKTGTQRIRPKNKSQTTNSSTETTKHHSNSFAPWAASNKKASLSRGHSCLERAPISHWDSHMSPPNPSSQEPPTTAQGWWVGHQSTGGEQLYWELLVSLGSY